MLITFFLAWTILTGADHDFHVSVTRVVYQKGQLQFTGRYFAEDLEAALRQKTGKALVLDKQGGHQAELQNYLEAHFSLQSPEAGILPLQWLGYELEGDLCFVYYEYTLERLPERLCFSNRLLFDQFEDQSNLLNFENEGKLHSAFLRPGEDRQCFDLK